MAAKVQMSGEERRAKVDHFHLPEAASASNVRNEIVYRLLLTVTLVFIA